MPCARLESSGAVPDFIFLDPPYEMEKAYIQTLSSLSKVATVLKPESYRHRRTSEKI